MLGLPQDLCNAGLLWELLEVCVGVRLLREGQGKMVLSLEVVAGWAAETVHLEKWQCPHSKRTSGASLVAQW